MNSSSVEFGDRGTADDEKQKTLNAATELLAKSVYLMATARSITDQDILAASSRSEALGMILQGIDRAYAQQTAAKLPAAEADDVPRRAIGE